MHSIRNRLLFGIMATTFVVMLVATASVYGIVQRRMHDAFNSSLASKLQSLASLVEQDGELIDIEFHKHPPQEFGRQERPEYYQVWHADGTVLARSRHLETLDLPQVDGALLSPVFQTLTLPDGRAGRVAGATFLPIVEEDFPLPSSVTIRPDDHDDDHDVDLLNSFGRDTVTLVIARDTADLDLMLTQLGWLLGGGCVAAQVLSLLVLTLIVRREFRPLDRLAQEIKRIDAETLAIQIPEVDLREELLPVVAQLNELMQRLRAAFLRERTLTADVAHELRTPLAGLRSIMDVTLRHPRDFRQYRQAIAECLDICQGTQRITETLLSLARADSGQVEYERRVINLELFLSRTWEQYRASADAIGVDVAFSCDGDLYLNTDPDQLRLVIGNLFDNAVSYVDEKGRIAINAAALNDTTLCLLISNSGCTLSPSDASRTFDRFWRADSARTAHGSHVGLGLALCQRIVAALHGTISVSVEGGRFVVKLVLPRECVEEPYESDEPQRPNTASISNSPGRVPGSL